MRRLPLLCVAAACLLLLLLLSAPACSGEPQDERGSESPVPLPVAASEREAAAPPDWQQYVPEQYRQYTQPGGGGGGAGDEGEADSEESAEGRARASRRAHHERQVEEREERSVERTHGGRRERLRLRKTEREVDSEREDSSGRVRHSRSVERDDKARKERGSKEERRHHRGGGGGGRGDGKRSQRLAETTRLTDEMAVPVTLATPRAAPPPDSAESATESSCASHCWLLWPLLAAVALLCVLLLTCACAGVVECGGWRRCRERGGGNKYSATKEHGDDTEQ